MLESVFSLGGGFSSEISCYPGSSLTYIDLLFAFGARVTRLGTRLFVEERSASFPSAAFC